MRQAGSRPSNERMLSGAKALLGVVTGTSGCITLSPVTRNGSGRMWSSSSARSRNTSCGSLHIASSVGSVLGCHAPKTRTSLGKHLPTKPEAGNAAHSTASSAPVAIALACDWEPRYECECDLSRSLALQPMRAFILRASDQAPRPRDVQTRTAARHSRQIGRAHV